VKFCAINPVSHDDPLESMFSVVFIAVSVGENEMAKEERIRRL